MSDKMTEYIGKSRKCMPPWLMAVVLMLTAALAVSLMACSDGSAQQPGEPETVVSDTSAESTTQTTTTTTKAPIVFNVGDIFEYGSYEQDGDLENGTEPIAWRVLDVEEDRVLVISIYCLDCKLFHDTVEHMSWETCTLRAWMNNDFIDTAFSEAEQQGIIEVELEHQDNPKYYTKACENTMDRVFFLSIDEANRYFTSDEDRICYPTPYARSNGSFQSDIARYGGLWWLRTPGNGYYNAADVTEYGIISLHGIYSFNVKVSIRPAMYISMDTLQELMA